MAAVPDNNVTTDPLRDAEENARDYIADVASLKAHMRKFDKIMKLNQELRIKFENDPEKFMDSEVDLDDELDVFESITGSAALIEAFVDNGGIITLVGLLGHSNSDIVIHVCKLFAELVDPEVIVETQKSQTIYSTLFEDTDFLTLLSDVLYRLRDKTSIDDYQGVTHILNILSNLLEGDAALVTRHIVSQGAASCSLLKWLLLSVKPSEDHTVIAVDPNRLSCAELLSIILQHSPQARELVGRDSRNVLEIDGLDILLLALAEYRKTDPANLEEEEFVENIGDCIEILLFDKNILPRFEKNEGIELMIRFIRQRRKKLCPLALRLLALAMAGHIPSCDRFVSKLGLGPLFSLFMERSSSSKLSDNRTKDIENILACIHSCLMNCRGTSNSRVIMKFIENDFEKLKQLCDLHCEFAKRLNLFENELRDDKWVPIKNYELEDSISLDEDSKEGDIATRKRNKDSEDEFDDDVYNDRCEMGLGILTLIDLIFLRLTMQSYPLISTQIHTLFDAQMTTDIARVLREHLDRLPSDSRDAERDWRALRSALNNFIASHDEEVMKGKKLLAELPVIKKPTEKKPVAIEIEKREPQSWFQYISSMDADREEKERRKRRKNLD